MDKDMWNNNIRKSLKEFATLRDIFTKSDSSQTQYKSVLSSIGKLLTSFTSETQRSDYKKYADELNEIVSMYNDVGDNLMMKNCVSFFANRLRRLNPQEAALFVSEINQKDNHRFVEVLQSYGYYVDLEEAEQKKREEERRQKAEEERRKKAEEERKKREIEEFKRREEQAKPSLKKGTYCTNCGYKFPSNDLDYCTQCGQKRLLFNI